MFETFAGMDADARSSGDAMFPQELADRCVKCGLCLPHCPTYRVAGVEGESPRGRIALMQALASGRLAPDTRLVDHLEQCLACRACERVCPAEVPYGRLIDAGRALLARGHPPGPLRRLAREFACRPGWLRTAAAIARVSGAAALGRRAGGHIGRLAGLLPRSGRSLRPGRAPAPASTGPRGEALLFTGCVSAALDGRTLEDSAALLAAAGWGTLAPRRQGCCGALHLHAGDPARARRMARRNLAALEGEGPVVACASGCEATLREYGELLGTDEARRFASRVTDPLSLVVVAALPFHAPAVRRLVLHQPCTQRNVTCSGDATRRALDRLPGVEVLVLPDGCCGAAGEMMVSRPQLADRLLAPLLDRVEALEADALLTSNIGCALHFRAALERRGRDLPVLHPASLLAASLQAGTR